MNCCKKNSTTCPSFQILTQLGAALYLYHTVVADKCLCLYELFRELYVQVGAVGNKHDGRTGKSLAAHKHTGKKEHRKALSAACRAEVCTALSVAAFMQARVFKDIVKKLMRGKKLRITAYYLALLLR